MQIDFASSGGFANVELSYRGDTTTMPEEQARELWFNDVTAPASVRPLIAFLRKMAAEERRKGK
jgi:hypothetical protein